MREEGGITKIQYVRNDWHFALTKPMREGAAIFSLEMSKEELVDRLLVSHADIDAWRLKRGKLAPEDTKAVIEVMGDLSEAPIYIDDTTYTWKNTPYIVPLFLLHQNALGLADCLR
jgi:replicative DNA helicase